MRINRFQPSGAVAIAVVALVIGLEAPAMAHQVRVVAHQISGSSIKANTVTGKQVKESSLGVVPKAATADKAKLATNAGTATNATKLGGKPASAYAAATSSFTSGMVKVPLNSGYIPFATVGPLVWEANCFSDGDNTGLLVQVTASEPTFLTIGADNRGDSAQNLQPTPANSPVLAGVVQENALGEGHLSSIAVSTASGSGYVGQLYLQAAGLTAPGCLAELTATG